MVGTARSDRPVAPLYFPRVLSLLLAWCFSLVGAALGVNALVKSNKAKNDVIKAVPPPTVVNISTRNVQVPGYIATAGCFAILVITTIALILSILRKRSSASLLLASILLGLLSIWLLGSLIAETVFFATGSAKVTAFLNGQQLPDNVFKAVQSSLGVTSVYNKISYLRNSIILQWLAFFFTAIAAIVLAVASISGHRRRDHEGQSSLVENKEHNGAGVNEKATNGTAPTTGTGPSKLGTAPVTNATSVGGPHETV